MLGLVRVLGRIVVQEDMIATERRRLPTDLHPPERAQGRFPLGSGSSTVKTRLVSQPEKQLLMDPEGLCMVRFEARSNVKQTYMKPRIRHMLAST